ncbi:MAG: Lactate utilization protein B [Planctomycetes bacterium ADurb.Bin126]|nr:MAG: Lactate utilization protein B [Planctomycetes bacterium ADurb.Bin126]HOD84681.1 LutB/LldF family L-lactate oxidation iron-sulfur protein [Phycisphaerae bacterium]HQL76421.1 LutB/LldF family L-lactate oxidation iron-sulfur protein [Phycisphaerae bacterium]
MTSPAKLFKKQSAAMARDDRHRQWVHKALSGYEVKRDEKTALFADWQAARTAAAEMKRQALSRLDELLVELETNLTARGAKVHWAADAESACRIVRDIARARNAKKIIKSKSMTTEEIHLNGALEADGVEVVESDLGEFIVQLLEQAPYHIVFPAMHLTRHEISDLFARVLGSTPTDSPEELTMIARAALRQKYVRADIGITGANFAIAETGMIAVTENEGNSRLTSALPACMITVLGIEKVLPRMEDLAVFWPMLASVGAGQLISGYNTLYGGPRQEGESDGPEEYHVVLLDNRRTALLADAEQRDLLHCIRCGGCLNVCPVYRNIGGHSYGTTYAGPIGAVLTPHMRGLDEFQHLSYASSLCGACSALCPVRIPLHHHLLHNRRNAAREHGSWIMRFAFRFHAKLSNSRLWWKLATKLGRFGQKFHWLIKGTFLDPARPWTATREPPKIARQSFKEWWRKRS